MSLAAVLPAIQGALAEAGLDGWLLYEFNGQNPVAASVLALGTHVSRRAFAWIPAVGTPVAVQHAIERHIWRSWPAAWERRVYSGWAELEATLASLVGGRTIAMEYSPGNAVPYIDRVPAGVLEMVRAAGATVRGSDVLVTRFAAALDPDALAGHVRAAEAIAAVADAAMRRAGDAARAGAPITEHTLQQWITGEFAARGLAWTNDPIV
nr:hypothetical protein [Gemmatimonadaceae bacterium]